MDPIPKRLKGPMAVLNSRGILTSSHLAKTYGKILRQNIQEKVSLAFLDCQLGVLAGLFCKGTTRTLQATALMAPATSP